MRMPPITTTSGSRTYSEIFFSIAHSGLRRSFESSFLDWRCSSFSAAFLFLGLHLVQVAVEAIESFVPKATVAFEPVVDLLEGAWLDAARPPLRLAAPHDEVGALQHLEMLGDGRQAHVEWLGELGDRGLTECEPRQDGAPRRIGERRKGGAEAIGCHGAIEPDG